MLAVEAFRATDPVTFEETWSTASIAAITDGAYRRAYLGSLQLSAITAVLGAVLGLALAVAVLRARRGRLLRRLVLTASGVLANFGGIPLAFAFLATIGNAGVVTALLTDTLGLGLGGFSLYSMAGLALVYLYFLIPLMVLTIVPALEALRPQWREAADNLGASGWQYWRYVGGPVLAPPVIGATMLLFASAFAAYATARGAGRQQRPAGHPADRRRALEQRRRRLGEPRQGAGAGHGRARRPGDGLLRLGAAPHPAVAGMTALIDAGVAGAGSVAARDRRSGRGRRGAGAWRFVVLAVLGLYFLVPIAASVWFTVRDRAQGGVTARHYAAIPGAEGFAEAFTRSLAIAGLTVVIALLLMVPTVVLVNLRLPRLRTTVELLTLMPLVLPPIALVVGRAQRAGLGAGLLPEHPAGRGVLRPPGAVAALDPRARLRRPGAAVRLPRPGRRRARRRPAHAHRGRPQPRGVVAPGAGLGRPAGAAHVGAQRLVPHPRPRAGGVHDRRHPRLRDLPDLDRADLGLRSRSCRSPSRCSRSLFTWVLLLLISALDRRRGTKETA